MVQQTPHWTQQEHAVEAGSQYADDHTPGEGVTTEPRGNGDFEQRDVDQGVDKLERVLGW